jgi:tRNA(Ile)-lysidine synthase TilS/MesJ
MLQRGASRMEIRARYLELAKLIHPDSAAGSNPAAFAQVSNAYEQLRSSFAGEEPACSSESSFCDEDGDMTYLMKLRRCVSTLLASFRQIGHFRAVLSRAIDLTG